MDKNPQKAITIYEAERIHLPDKVAGARGNYTEVSILDPGIRIERSPPTHDRGPDGRPRTPEEHYRIALNFKLQVALLSGFDQQASEYYQRLFHSISLRYLFRHGEWHYVKPRGDPAAQLRVTDETANSKSLDAGVQNIGPNPTGKMEAHVQANDKISYQGTMTSWREGLDYEPYHHHPHHPKHNHFDVHSHCPKHHPSRKWRCSPPNGDRYDTAAHWQWEVNLKLNHWAPDVYQSFSRRVTIIRFVPVEDIERLIRGARDPAQLERYLHFDFVVTTVGRELGHGWKNLKKYIPGFMRPDPVEQRVRADKGFVLEPDRAHFCVAVCGDLVRWPAGQTANLQEVADEQVGKPVAERQRYATTKGKGLDEDGSGEDDSNPNGSGQAQREQQQVPPINIYIASSGPGYETRRETTERTRIRDAEERDHELHGDYETGRGRWRVSSASRTARLGHAHESESWPNIFDRRRRSSDRPKFRVVDRDEEHEPLRRARSEPPEDEITVEEEYDDGHHQHHHPRHHHHRRHRSHSPSYYHQRGHGHHVKPTRHRSLTPDRRYPRDGR